jgi:Predicted transcriptional regulators containing the CopG/Arc/MetJ DNA-binding domain
MLTKDYNNVPKKQNPVVGVRMPVEAINRMDAAVATGRYRSRGDYIMAAIRLLEETESAKIESSAETSLEKRNVGGKT